MNFLLLVGNRGQALEDDVDVLERVLQIERAGDGVRTEPAADGGILLEERAEVELLLPGTKRVSLHEPIGVVPPETGLDERSQHARAEDEAVRGIEVVAHPRGVDDETLHEPREAIDM